MRLPHALLVLAAVLTCSRASALVLPATHRWRAGRLVMGDDARGVVSSGWAAAQKKRKAEEAEQYERMAEQAAKAAEARANEAKAAELAKAQMQAQRNAQAAEYTDKQVNQAMIGRPTGFGTAGVVTRDMLADAERATSPVAQAEDALAKASQECGELEPAECVAMLARSIAEARAAGMRPESNALKKAVALYVAMKAAAAQLEEAAADADAAAEAADPATAKKKDAMDALFGGGYAEPGL